MFTVLFLPLIRSYSASASQPEYNTLKPSAKYSSSPLWTKRAVGQDVCCTTKPRRHRNRIQWYAGRGQEQWRYVILRLYAQMLVHIWRTLLTPSQIRSDHRPSTDFDCCKKLLFSSWFLMWNFPLAKTWRAFRRRCKSQRLTVVGLPSESKYPSCLMAIFRRDEAVEPWGLFKTYHTIC